MPRIFVIVGFPTCANKGCLKASVLKSDKTYLPDTLNRVRHKLFQVLNGITADGSSAEKLMQYLEGR
jgi:hypothetical protein